MNNQSYYKIIFFAVVIFGTLSAKNEKKIKLYTFYSPSHEKLFYEWFLPTLQDDFELIVEQCPQECPTALFWQEGWGKTMLRKVNLILRGIKENWGKVFVYADIDIQFFKPMQELILKEIGDKDIVIQRNNPSGEVCAGFLACRGNERTRALWKNVKQIMIETKHPSDQKALNSIIRSTTYKGAVWDYLPVEFFGGGTLTGKVWKPGDFLSIPRNIVLHHANWTDGIEGKIEQLLQVRNSFENGIYMTN